jgi:hypothetical protein
MASTTPNLLSDESVLAEENGMTLRQNFSFLARLRTDLQSAPPGIPLRQITVEADFGEVRVPTLDAPLWLPSRVVATRNLAGFLLRETHTYSNYRLFRAKSKLLINP